MISLSSIVADARSAYGAEFELHYLHPTLYLVCKDEVFGPLHHDARVKLFEQRTHLSVTDFSSTGLASILSLVLVTNEERRRDYDFLDVPSPGRHWLPLLDPTELSEQPNVSTGSP